MMLRAGSCLTASHVHVHLTGFNIEDATYLPKYLIDVEQVQIDTDKSNRHGQLWADVDQLRIDSYLNT